MVDRRLVLHVEGSPVVYDSFVGGIRATILTYPDDFADLFQIWSVPSPERRLLEPANDITERFAIEWSKEFEFAAGGSSTEAMRLFPAFVREVAQKHLMQAWHIALATERPVKAG